MRIPLIVTVTRSVAVHEGVQKYNTLLLIILGAFLAHVAADGESAEVQGAEDAGRLLIARMDCISTETEFGGIRIALAVQLIADSELAIRCLILVIPFCKLLLEVLDFFSIHLLVFAEFVNSIVALLLLLF